MGHDISHWSIIIDVSPVISFASESNRIKNSYPLQDPASKEENGASCLNVQQVLNSLISASEQILL